MDAALARDAYLDAWNAARRAAADCYRELLADVEGVTIPTVRPGNEDVWHLMNAVGSLRSMYGLMRAIIFGTLVLSVIGFGLIVFGMMGK